MLLAGWERVRSFTVEATSEEGWPSDWPWFATLVHQTKRFHGHHDESIALVPFLPPEIGWLSWLLNPRVCVCFLHLFRYAPSSSLVIFFFFFFFFLFYVSKNNFPLFNHSSSHSNSLTASLKEIPLK